MVRLPTNEPTLSIPWSDVRGTRVNEILSKQNSQNSF